MAAHPKVVVGEDGTVVIPESLQKDPRFKAGAVLELIPVISNASAPDDADKGDWRRLDGILAKDEPFDATAWKQQEREWELAHDERKFGIRRPAW